MVKLKRQAEAQEVARRFQADLDEVTEAARANIETGDLLKVKDLPVYGIVEGEGFLVLGGREIPAWKVRRDGKMDVFPKDDAEKIPWAEEIEAGMKTRGYQL
jgi:hypothetical protein